MLLMPTKANRIKGNGITIIQVGDTAKRNLFKPRKSALVTEPHDKRVRCSKSENYTKMVGNAILCSAIKMPTRTLKKPKNVLPPKESRRVCVGKNEQKSK